MQPPSQKFRPIGFFLTGGAGSAVRLDLPVRPEELTKTEPARTNAVQTLGGAYVDAFGAGLATITLSGHCGWRGAYFLSGEDVFFALRDTVFVEWCRRIEAAAAAGTDPASVSLFYVDTLNNVRHLVAPKSFVMRRSRSSPLLIRYQITLTVLDDGTPFGLLDTIISALSNPLRWLAGVTGMTNTLVTLNTYLGTGLRMLGAARQVATQVLGIGISLLGTVRDVARQVRGVFEGPDTLLLDTARAFSQAARNAFSALAGVPSISNTDRAALMGIAAAFNDSYCNLWNSFGVGRYFKSYDDLYGASNCSSTGGGRPASIYAETGANPFSDMFPSIPNPVTVTAEATAAMATLAAEPLRLAGSETETANLLAPIAAGVRIAA